MREVTVTTTTGTEGEPGYFSWPVSYNEPETVDEFVDLYGGQANLVSALQAALRQSATQNNKTVVASVAKKFAAGDVDQTAVDEAIRKHQEGVSKYRPGAPRTASDGVRMTQKQRQALGAAVGKFAVDNGKLPSQKDMAAIAEELGIDLAALGS